MIHFRGVAKWAIQACIIPHGLTVSSRGVYGAGWERVWHNDGVADTHLPPDLMTSELWILFFGRLSAAGTY